jgi:hypothetical protein
MQLPCIGLLFGVLCTTAYALPAPPECNSSTTFHTYDGAVVQFLREVNATISTDYSNNTRLNGLNATWTKVSTRLNATLTKFSHLDPEDGNAFKALDPGNRICGTQDTTLLEAMQRKQSSELEKEVAFKLDGVLFYLTLHSSPHTSFNTSAGNYLIGRLQDIRTAQLEGPLSKIQVIFAFVKVIVNYVAEDDASLSWPQFDRADDLSRDVFRSFGKPELDTEATNLVARDLPLANGSAISETEAMLASLRAYKAALSETPPNATHIYHALMETMSLGFTAGDDDASVDPDLEAKQLAQMKELTHDIVILENNLNLDDQTSALIPRGTDWRKHVKAWLNQSIKALNPFIDRLELFNELKALAHHNMKDDDPHAAEYLAKEQHSVDELLEIFNYTICQDMPIGTTPPNKTNVPFTKAYLTFLNAVKEDLSAHDADEQVTTDDKCHFLADWADFYWQADKFPGSNTATKDERREMASLEDAVLRYLKNAKNLTTRDSVHVARSDKSLMEVEIKFMEETKKALLKTPVDKSGFFNARTKFARALTAVNHGFPIEDEKDLDQADKLTALEGEVQSLVREICPDADNSTPDMEIDLTFPEMCTAYLEEVKAALSESPVNLRRFLAADDQYNRWDDHTYPRASKHDLDTHEIKTLVKDIRKLLKKTKVMAARDSTTATGMNLIDPEDTSEADEFSKHNVGRDGELSDQNKTALDVLNEALTSTEVITVTATLSNEQ